MRTPATLTLATSGLKVYDNVLAEESFLKVWKLMNVLPYRSTAADDWIRVWNISDGDILRSRQYRADRTGTITSSDDSKSGLFFTEFIRSFLAIIADDEHFSTTKTILFIPYVWPPKTGISWHTDVSRKRVGAFSYYVHKYWNAEWGGVFLLSDARGEGAERRSVFDNQQVSDRILEKGHGLWVAPKPNRLVLHTDRILHKVAKTTENAAPRLSIQGFMYSDDR